MEHIPTGHVFLKCIGLFFWVGLGLKDLKKYPLLRNSYLFHVLLENFLKKFKMEGMEELVKKIIQNKKNSL
jgi:hypothetical protein